MAGLLHTPNVLESLCALIKTLSITLAQTAPGIAREIKALLTFIGNLMPTNIAGESTTYPQYVRAPAGSDARNATTIAMPLQDLADRTAYLAGRLGGATAADGVWYPIPITAAHLHKNGGDISWETISVAGDEITPGLITLAAVNPAISHSFVLPISPFLPPAGVLRAFAIDQYSTSTYTDLPQYMPSAKLYNLDPATRVLTMFVGPGEARECVDTTVLAADYMDPHEWGDSTLSGGTYTIIDLSIYRNIFLRIVSEYGTNAQVGSIIYHNPKCKVAPAGWTQQ